MKEKPATTNKGYSLVETIIVIAIILILSVMAVATITIINSARTKDAAVSFGEEVSTLKLKCMNMVPTDASYDTFGVSLYRTSDGKYNCSLIEYNKATNAFTHVSGEETHFSSAVRVEFVGGTDSSVKKVDNSGAVSDVTGTVTLDNDEEMIILFNKNGTCSSGYSNGTGFAFYRNNSTNPVARVVVSKNGGIVIK